MSITSIPSSATTAEYATRLGLFRRKETCSGSLQKCQKPSTLSNNSTTIIVAVVVPVVACLLFISFFVYRNWKKGKEEALEDDDPDFNGDNTILPDIDMGYYNGGTESKFVRNDGNPFENESDLKYPSNVYSNQPGKGSPYNHSSFFNNDSRSVTNTINAGRYVDSFVLPYGEQTGSKRSLDEFARGMGHYSAYAAVESPNQSRTSSMTRSVHPFSKSSDILSKTNLSHVVSQEEHQDHETKDSSDLTDMKSEPNTGENFEIGSSSTSDDLDESFKDTRSEIPEQASRPTSNPSISTANLMKNLDANVSGYNRASYIESHNNNRASYVSNGEEILITDPIEQDEVNKPEMIKEEDDDIDDPTLSPDEREKLRRMKSIYNVYFDRENSIKHKRKDNNEEVVLPPLPALPNIVTTTEDDTQQVPEENEQEEVDEGDKVQNLTINTNFDRNYASSVYPENPLNDYEPYQQDMYLQQQQQYYPQQQQQQYYPQQQQYYPQQQQYYRQAPPPQQQRRGIPMKSNQSLSKLAQLPTPSELNQRPYSAINFHTEYQPKSSFKASSSPKITSPPQGFNPMEQWTPDSESLQITPTAISRNSVAMTNPTLITKSKLYKPAGSMAAAATEYARHSPQMMHSPVFGAPQSPMSSTASGHYMTPTSESSNFGPGSRQDFRNYVDNMNV